MYSENASLCSKRRVAKKSDARKVTRGKRREEDKHARNFRGAAVPHVRQRHNPDIVLT